MSIEDEYSIQGPMSGRSESPTFEHATRLQIEASLQSLIQSKTLYQNVEIDLREIEKELAAVGEHFIKAFETERFKGGVTARQIEKIKQESRSEWEKRHATILAEVPYRPWTLKTRHRGDDRTIESIIAASSQGISQPLNTPDRERNLCFYAPAVHLVCGKCKNQTSFEALNGSTEGGFGHPFPVVSGGVRVQLYLIFYRCVLCREQVHGVLIRRRGLKLSLCGFAPRREQQSSRKLKKSLSLILQDANNAVAEGDLSAGFYHARTLLEHYLKDRLGLVANARERGEDLITRHYEALSPRLREALPPLSTVFADLSDRLHSRTGTKADFDSLTDKLCAHIEAVDLLEKFDKA